MADYSIKRPLGILEDVEVRIDNCLFSIDFMVVKVDEGKDTTLIFGRPFLATSQAKINISKGKIKLRVGKEKVIFHIAKSTSSSKVEKVHNIKAND